MAAPRLSVGVISAGAVGVAVGAALERVGHRVRAVVAPSAASATRARLRLPGARVGDIADVAGHAELILLAVPDPALPAVAEEVARHVGPGRIVVHVAGALGRAVLDPVALTGAMTIAAHPAMTFAGVAADVDRLAGCHWGVTVGDDLSRTVAELLIGELGGRAVLIPERSRTLYHAAMAHGANHLGAVVGDAVRILAEAVGDRGPAVDLLAPLLSASLDNVLRYGDSALTGPAARDDAAAVAAHLRELERAVPGAAPGYATLARRIAQLRGCPEVLRLLDAEGR
ncbi:glycerol-3-phosphate dehydrogenase [Corynebacterium sphenisci DSM 44792]|uniref:Glycerol-3-phosphate dehydrogenase n=1 Tax=Corynebacterium sphenisci DSM 44792 TaxID=1437874 RepID=A0A1L7CZV7_9CORY|nr:DUF2520 domain-containing protein [Corynebacterium sphenisci]APT91388.1 glycerol-3-phosphate dehydrogenase [Corynebacterium sphenisci DSM 44792]